MSAVAEAAGVGRATLYRHFPSREDLVKELSLEAIRVTDQAVAPVFARQQPADEALLGMIEALVPFGDRYHFLANELQVTADREVAAATKRQLDELAAFVEQAKHEQLFAADLPTTWIVAAIDSLLWAAWNSMGRGELASRDAARLVVRSLVDGMRPRR